MPKNKTMNNHMLKISKIEKLRLKQKMKKLNKKYSSR